MGLCVLKLLTEAGATQSPSSEKPGTFGNVGVDEMDGDDDAVDVSMVLDRGFVSSMESISSWIAMA